MTKPKQFKIFSWEPTDKCSLQEFKDSLISNGWTVLDDMEYNGVTSIYCEMTAQVFSNSFSDN